MKANDKDENPHIRYVISEIFTSEDSEGLNDIPKPAFNITSGKRYLLTSDYIWLLNKPYVNTMI